MSQAGFTLLEILLVIVMIAVTAAMIVPSLDISGASIEDEAKRLRSTLRYAMQESELSGQPLRWVATKYAWSFEVLSKDDKKLEPDFVTGQMPQPKYSWQPYEDEPLTTYNLPQPLLIKAVNQAIEFDLGIKVESKESDGEAEPVIGSILFLPDGTTSLSDIVLASEAESVEPITLRVRPGPAGIRFKKESDR